MSSLDPTSAARTSTGPTDGAVTVIAPSRPGRLAVVVGLPLLGVLAGWVVLAFHDAWLGLDWVPLRGPVELVDRFVTWAGPWGPAALLGAGLVVGVILAVIAVHEEVRLDIDDRSVRITRGDSVREHRATDVREVLLDGHDLVLVAQAGTELSRVRNDYRRSRLAAAFRRHGYTWLGRD